MGIIFYWKATNEIYGVHPDLETAPKLPDGIVHIEVPQSPDKIPWPVPVGKNSGHEQWTVVDTTTTPPTLKVNPKLVFEPDPDVELEKAVKAATTLEEIKSALLANVAAKRKTKGKPI